MPYHSNHVRRSFARHTTRGSGSGLPRGKLLHARSLPIGRRLTLRGGALTSYDGRPIPFFSGSHGPVSVFDGLVNGGNARSVRRKKINIQEGLEKAYRKWMSKK